MDRGRFLPFPRLGQELPQAANPYRRRSAGRQGHRHAAARAGEQHLQKSTKGKGQHDTDDEAPTGHVTSEAAREDATTIGEDPGGPPHICALSVWGHSPVHRGYALPILVNQALMAGGTLRRIRKAKRPRVNRRTIYRMLRRPAASCTQKDMKSECM